MVLSFAILLVYIHHCAINKPSFAVSRRVYQALINKEAKESKQTR